MLLEKRIEQFRTELAGELTRFQVGSRIYTHRELVERFHVSRRVVDGALARLEADGILEVRPQSGIYLLHKKEKFQLALFHPDYPAETLEKHRNCLAAECERQAGVFDFAEVAYDYRADIAELVGQASADAIVLIPPPVCSHPPKSRGFSQWRSRFSCGSATSLKPEFRPLTAAVNLPPLPPESICCGTVTTVWRC